MWKVRIFADFTGKFEVFDGGGWRVDFGGGGAGMLDFSRDFGSGVVIGMKESRFEGCRNTAVMTNYIITSSSSYDIIIFNKSYME